MARPNRRASNPSVPTSPVQRKSGSEHTNYIAGEVDPVGAFTARVDLADYLLALVSDSTAIAKTVIVSTTEGTPTMWQMIRREAFKTDQPKNAAASS